ncbi:MAG: zinc transporter ZupT [Victivallales bacterium]|nr:zinc transporter ZupT [Victivallales bacterium]MCF7889368.1 zinc transporter ZupT [Victivallales bacterium]
MNNSSIYLAFIYTLAAGLCTGIGSFIAMFSKTFNRKFFAAALGFSAGVMIYVSFVDIFVKSKDSLTVAFGYKTGYWYTVLAFFSGIMIIGIIDRLVPDFENPHEIRNINDPEYEVKNREKLMRMGVFSALAIAIHNFPEGLATFLGTLHDPAVGLSIGSAIAIHNIPEGIAVAVPIYYATKSKKKAFCYSFLSGLAEPLGAIIGYFILRSIFTDEVFGLTFGCVAGIMIYISLDELLPTAEKYGEHHIAIYGLISGMALMALSLLLFI